MLDTVIGFFMERECMHVCVCVGVCVCVCVHVCAYIFFWFISFTIFVLYLVWPSLICSTNSLFPISLQPTGIPHPFSKSIP